MGRKVLRSDEVIRDTLRQISDPDYVLTDFFCSSHDRSIHVAAGPTAATLDDLSDAPDLVNNG